MQNQLLAILMVAVLPAVSAHHTKRPPPKPVPPLIHNGIEYRAPQHVDHLGTVEAWDVKTRQRIWWRQIYVVMIDVAMETDVQWVFIKIMNISGYKLIIVNERGHRYELDLDSLEVSTAKGNPLVEHEE